MLEILVNSKGREPKTIIMYTCYNKPFFLWYCLAVGLSEAKNDVNANGKNGTTCHGLGDTLPKS